MDSGERPLTAIVAVPRGLVMIVLTVLLGCTQSTDDQSDSDSLEVCVSTPDVKSLVETIAGDRATVHCFVQGPQDPHQVDIRPSHVRIMERAGLWIQVGKGVEAAWYPNLTAQLRNTQVKPGGERFLDLSSKIRPVEAPDEHHSGPDTHDGLHPEGNPHYLLNPVEGIKAAKAIADKLADILPEHRNEFQERWREFNGRVGEKLVGKLLNDKQDAVEIARLFADGELDEFLKSNGESAKLEGWLGALQPHFGAEIVGDHDLWPYFCHQAGLSVLGYLEPEPGIASTTKHLNGIVAEMRTRQVKILLTAPFFDARLVAFVTERTGARALPMAHQTGARPGTEDYLTMVDYNMNQVLGALQNP